ncbi:MAG: OsmC family protein [Gammaproteobacteria bacterium]|nr:OsmC family protein [Gammaproteobacteria bacterium]
MKTNLTWAGGAAFIGEAENGRSIVIDGPPAGGGKNLGPRPMETLLLGMGACMSYDVLSILKKSRQDLSACRVEISSTRATEHPMVFTAIRVHFIITGAALKAAQVERAINLSAEKYCSASSMLGKTAQITHSYEIVPQE